MTTNAVHANFRYNGLEHPNSVGMDEDYDAADLENWFLAMQSADGSVIIPSFHRPSAIRIDTGDIRLSTTGAVPPNTAQPTTGPTRPRGSSAPAPPTATTRRRSPTWFPDATARSPTTWTTTATAITDSVWLDLGYPARRNAQGQLYKPLFSFMVIGLNGRIPLNTAGNLAGNARASRTPPARRTYTYGGGAVHAAAPGQLGQRGRPDIRAAERL